MKKNINDLSKYIEECSKPRESLIVEIRKLNKNNNLCYYDRIDLTCKNISEDTLDIFCKLFEKAGFIFDIKRNTYFGIYDPSRFGELIEIYPTNEELLEKELRWKNWKLR